MKGDFTRNTFDPTRHFSRVLMQQGRVQLDADFNEQAAILLDYLRMMMVDLIGPYGRPEKLDAAVNQAFEISLSGTDITIMPGRYYVDGIPCENDSEVTYSNICKGDKKYYVYLDVWERHITHVQDDFIREKALGGPDTCSRAKVVWQVRFQEIPAKALTEARIKELKERIGALSKPPKTEDTFLKTRIQRLINELEKRIKLLGTPTTPSCSDAKTWINGLPKLGNVLMQARLQPEKNNDDACSVAPESRYRGAENQLYRIEIHRGGAVWDGKSDKAGNPSGNAAEAATFKWSRDNGSIVFPIIQQDGAVATLQSFGRDERTSLKIGEWVEIMDDEIELQGKPGIMAQVDKVDPVEMKVTLRQPAEGDSGFWPAYDEKSIRHPLLRRWDHRAIEGIALQQGAILTSESDDPDSGWIEIEDGIEVQFQPVASEYRTGDYWLIPARVTTGKIEWPLECDDEGQILEDKNGNEISKAISPHGIEHHYAPLAVVEAGKPTDCRCTFKPLPCQGA